MSLLASRSRVVDDIRPKLVLDFSDLMSDPGAPGVLLGSLPIRVLFPCFNQSVIAGRPMWRTHMIWSSRHPSVVRVRDTSNYWVVWWGGWSEFLGLG